MIDESRWARLEQLESDWDSYGGDPPRCDALRLAHTIAALLSPLGELHVFPTSTGGIELELEGHPTLEIGVTIVARNQEAV